VLIASGDAYDGDAYMMALTWSHSLMPWRFFPLEEQDPNEDEKEGKEDGTTCSDTDDGREG
jgi:hypothetical protein